MFRREYGRALIDNTLRTTMKRRAKALTRHFPNVCTAGQQTHERALQSVRHRGCSHQKNIELALQFTRVRRHRTMGNGCWRGYREVSILVFCWWDYKIEQSVGKRVFQRLTLEFRYGPELPLAYVFTGPDRTSIGTFKYVHVYAHSETLHHGRQPR